MPVKPQFDWQQTVDEVLLRVTIKGFKKDAVDVFIADVFVKVNAPPTYLLALDLLRAVDPEKSSHYFDDDDATILHVRLCKAESGVVWDALCVNGLSIGKKNLLERREQSMAREEARYNARLEARKQQQEHERRRMTEEQWEVEKRQRNVIEERVQMEKSEAEADLFAWEDAQQKKPSVMPHSPADVVASTAAASTSPAHDKGSTVTPQVRQAETVNVTIDFTPKVMAMPSRSRGDEDHYRRSRYKPVSVEDSPMFWKERADKHYMAREWKAAVYAYSESIKRDGVFMTCVMNRAACYLRLAEYKKAIDDCTLALTLLANTPASEVTQDRYRALMTKLHARRGAAHCWSEDFLAGVADLRMAAAYRDPEEDTDVENDLRLVEQLMVERGIVESDRDPLAARMQEASALYHQMKYAEAAAAYEAILVENPYHTHARCNLAAALLNLRQFREALDACTAIIEFCSEVAEALNEPGALSGGQPDSDDDDELEEVEGGVSTGEGAGYDGLARKRRAAAKKISESSGHVYLLLKAYVRGAAALCGLGDYRQAHTFLEQAVCITPYDNDLRGDCNRVVEKVRMDTLVAASTGGATKAC